MDINNLLSQSQDVSIAVMGRLILDIRYSIAHKHETQWTIDAPGAGHILESALFEPGGAGSIAVNCRRLGAGKVDVYGILGNDAQGDLLNLLLKGEGVGCDGIIRMKGAQTSLNHRIYSHTGVCTSYRGSDYMESPTSLIDRMIAIFERMKDTYHCAVFRGPFSFDNEQEEVCMEKIDGLINKTKDQIQWFDCRAAVEDAIPGTIRIIDCSEVHVSKPYIVLMGEQGVLVEDDHGKITIPGLHFIRKTNSTGILDAGAAGTAVAYASGASLREAAEVANFAVGVCMGNPFGNGRTDVDEVVKIAGDPNYRYNPKLAEDIRLARYLNDGMGETDIEIIRPVIENYFAGRVPASVVFDHDGTVSTLRQGWEEVMEEMMVRAVVGGEYETLPAALIGEIHLQVKSLIEKTTGVQTIIQMYELVSLIHDSGFVPKKEILTPMEYKKIYLNDLMKKIALRKKLFLSGMLSIEDLTLKGILPFLTSLREAGSTLYLASGTDQEDVQAEADLLGYGELFNGGVYGSVDDLENDPKQVVLKTIMENIAAAGGVDASRCVVFGDGPVEMREAKKRNLLALGVISDERQRFGKNLAKRKRLILAGADVLIPDFSWSEKLFSWIGWKKR